MDKIVVLNSGGFDSVCLLHYLSDYYISSEVYTLFFDYGQRALDKEIESAKRVSEKFGFAFHPIKLPKFNWSASGLVCTDNSEDYYLEMRNLIFLSYALSYAQSIGATSIFTAFTYPGTYPDTCVEFVDNFNRISNSVGVSLEVPFHNMTKEQVFWDVATKHHIKKGDFFSCLMNDELLGVKCPNCECLDGFYESYYNSAEYVSDLINVGNIPEAKEVSLRVPITQAKMFINDLCNMHCPYCITDGNTYMKQSKETYVSYIKHLHSLGVRMFDLMGKEPFINDDIFYIMDSTKHLEGIMYKTITNGKNLHKYMKEIKDSPLQSVCVSSDGNILREKVENLDNYLLELMQSGKQVSISLDVHSKNKVFVPLIILHYQKMGIKEIYVKPIIKTPTHSGDFHYYIEDIDFKDCVLSTLSNSHIDFREVTFSIPFHFKESTKVFNQIQSLKGVKLANFELDNHCLAGVDTVFITSDGFTYGCGNQAFLNPSSTRKNVMDLESLDELKKTVQPNLCRKCLPY